MKLAPNYHYLSTKLYTKYEIDMKKNCLFTMLTLLVVLLTASVQTATAQCPGCTINLPAGIPADTIYVDTLPFAFKNVYYQDSMSFRVPYTTDPLAAVAPPGTSVPTGLNVDYFKVVSVTGLPPGLSWIGDRPSPMIYNETAPDTRDGCIILCGTPAASGTFTINVNLEIQVAGIVFPTPPIPLAFIVYPDTNATFTTNISSGCAPFFVQINNLVPSNGEPNITYDWDFGNGTTSTSENPDSVEYTLADTGMVAIRQQVIIDTFPYLLDRVIVTATDCSDPIFNREPDMYMIIYDDTTQIINTDPNFGLIGNTQNNENAPDTMVFAGPLRLKNTPFLIEIWDDDTAEFNPDDQCGGGSISVGANDGAGIHVANNGGLSIQYEISHYIDTIVYIDSVFVQNCVSVEYLKFVERTLLVYPNPTADVVNVQFEMEGFAHDIEVVVSDMLGRNVYTESISNFEGQYNRQVDLKNYAGGIYVLQLKMGDKIAHRKIILSK